MRLKKIKVGDTFQPYGKREATITFVSAECIKFEYTIPYEKSDGILISGSMPIDYLREIQARNRAQAKKEKRLR